MMSFTLSLALKPLLNLKLISYFTTNKRFSFLFLDKTSNDEIRVKKKRKEKQLRVLKQ